MKAILITLCCIFFVLQYYLWFADDGILKAVFLQKMIVEQKQKNKDIEKQNTFLAKETNILKQSGLAIENRARADLGMVKKGEVFYQIIK